MRASVIACTALLCAASVSFASNGDTKEFKKFLTLEAPKLQAAYAHKDAAYFDKLYAPNFQTKDEHGVTNGKKVALYLLRYHFNTLQKIDYRMKLISLTAAKDSATVTLMSVLHAVSKARGGGQGSPLTVTRYEKQVFVKDGGGWHMALDQDLKPAKLIMKGGQPSTPMTLAPAKKNP